MTETRTPARRTLSRDLVLRTALEVLDEVGLDGLSLRRLAERLSVDPMTLYRFAASKDELLDAVTGMLYGEVLVEDTDDPRRAAHALAEGFRSTVLRHPHGLPLVAVRPLTVPMARRPPEALVLVEDLLELFESAGLDHATAVRCYRRITAWFLGWMLVELRTVVEDPEEEDPSLRLGLQHVPGRRFAHVRAAARTLDADLADDEDFHEGLDRLLDSFFPPAP